MTNPKATGDLVNGSLPAKVVEFFRANPDEELTSEDVATKFGLGSQREVMPRLKRPVSAGWLRVVRKERNCYARHAMNVYGAGVKLTAERSA
jgi:hypothetical protein